MILTKHNPTYKLISTIISLRDDKKVELVYGQDANGDNKGLEAYYFTNDLSLGHYKSYRWLEGKIPMTWLEVYNSLQNLANECPIGCKLSLR